MRWVARAAMILLLGAQAWRASWISGVEALRNETGEAYDAGEGEQALAAAQAALAMGDDLQATMSSLGDAAAYVYRHPPDGGWPDAELDRLAGLAWRGYAGAVLRCPIDSWSWSGLGEIAAREARRRDRARTLSLDEIDRRGEGILSGRYAVAIAAARLATRLQPSGYQQLDALARIYEYTGETELAWDTYVLSARMMPAPSFHAWGSGRRLSRSLYDAVMRGLREGLARAPRFERSQLELEVGRFARAQGDPDGAMGFLETAKSTAGIDYWRFQAAWELAGVHEEAGRFEEALAELKQAYDIGLSRPAVSRRMGFIHSRLGDFPGACTYLRETVRDEPDDPGLRAEAARCCEQAGEIDLAEQTLKEGVLRPNDDLALARGLLEFYGRVGRGRTASALLAQWRRDFPDQPEFEKWFSEFAARPVP